MGMKTKEILLINHNARRGHPVSVSWQSWLLPVALRSSNEAMCSEWMRFLPKQRCLPFPGWGSPCYFDNKEAEISGHQETQRAVRKSYSTTPVFFIQSHVLHITTPGSTPHLWDYSWDFCFNAQAHLDPLMLFFFSFSFLWGGEMKRGQTQDLLLESGTCFQRWQVAAVRSR